MGDKNKFWVIGNPKTEQLLFSIIKKYCENLVRESGNLRGVILGYAPPREAIFFSQRILKDSPNIMLGSQTIGERAKGTDTGMPVTSLLKEAGVEFVLINHIEAMTEGWGGRDISAQIRMAIEHGLIPILIVGEPVGSVRLSAEERKKNLAKTLSILSNFEEDELISGELAIAYESGFIPRLEAPLDIDYAALGFNLIGGILVELGMPLLAKKYRKIFGVGVSLETLGQALDVIQKNNLDGVLIGKSSVDANEFLEIARKIDREIAGNKVFSPSQKIKDNNQDAKNRQNAGHIPSLKKNIKVAIAGYGEVGAAIPAVLLPGDNISIIAETNPSLSPSDARARTYKNRFFEREEVLLYGEYIFIPKLRQRIKTISTSSIEEASKLIQEADILIFTAGELMKKPEILRPFFDAGVKNIILTSNSPAADITIIPGYNHHLFNQKKHKIVALGSCTATFGIPILAITAEIIGKENIEAVIVSGTHSKTNSQQIGDKGKAPKDECILNNLIPTTSGIKDTLSLPDFFPEAENDTDIIRTQVEHVSTGTMIIETSEKINRDEFKKRFKEIAETPRWKRIVVWDEEPDGAKIYWKSRAGAVIAAPKINVVGRMIKIPGYYANIFGYCSQLKRLIQVIGNKI